MSNAVQVDFLLAGLTDDSGNPLSGGLVYTREAGLETNKVMYTAANKSANATNPIVLNAYGQANVYAEGNYDIEIQNSAGVTLATWENVYFAYPETATKNMVTVTTTYSALTTPTCILANASGAAFTITLPNAVGNADLEHIVIKTDSTTANAVTIASAGGTINGAATVTISSQYGTMAFKSDGTNWFVTYNAATGTVTETGTQNLSNKTLVDPVLSGTVTGTYTLGGTPTISSDIIMGGQKVNRSVANDAFYISGGDAFNAGARLALYGNSHATLANVLHIIGTSRFYDASGNADRGIHVEDWTDVSVFGANWGVNGAATVSYMKDPMGRVWLKGTLVATGVGGTTAFTLPAGYRPAAVSIFHGSYPATLAVTSAPIITIDTDGTVDPNYYGNGAYMFLDGISFTAA